ncbi:MAG: hypothetical protein QF805_25780, partial [Pirellulaceae bacterium]|nr:hypothetical protein [Pirellulaceae bacterium]
MESLIATLGYWLFAFVAVAPATIVVIAGVVMLGVGAENDNVVLAVLGGACMGAFYIYAILLSLLAAPM